MNDDDGRILGDTVFGDMFAVGREIPVEDAVDRFGTPRSDFGPAHAGDEFVGIGIDPPLIKDHHLAVLTLGKIDGFLVGAFRPNQIVGGSRNRLIDAGFFPGRFGIGNKGPNLHRAINVLNGVISAVRMNDDQSGWGENTILSDVSPVRVIRRNQRTRNISFQKLHRFGLFKGFVDAGRPDVEVIAVE